MAFEHIKIKSLRNLKSVEIDAGAGINLVCGANGSGKTSLLEGLYMLAMARSFRTYRLASLISTGQEACQLFARVKHGGVSVSLGMMRRLDGAHQIRFNGQTLNTSAELVRLLPIQLIEPAAVGLLVAGPNARRQFLDWGVFHHHVSFHHLWKQAQRLIKQRNHSLKHGNIDTKLRASFDAGLIQVGAQIDNLRQEYLTSLIPVFFAILRTLSHATPVPDLTMTYYRGWNHDKDLVQVLDDTLERDKILGYTQKGPHRADVRFTHDGHDAAERLSRGQHKLVTIALRLAQGQLLSQSVQRDCIYLVDDLGAELDPTSRASVCEQLATLDTQVFITAVNQGDIMQYWPVPTVPQQFILHQGQVSTHN